MSTVASKSSLDPTVKASVVSKVMDLVNSQMATAVSYHVAPVVLGMVPDLKTNPKAGRLVCRIMARGLHKALIAYGFTREDVSRAFAAATILETVPSANLHESAPKASHLSVVPALAATVEAEPVEIEAELPSEEP